METVALILAVFFGAIGLLALVIFFFYAPWRSRQELRRGFTPEERRLADRLTGLVLVWIAIIAVVGGIAGSAEAGFASMILLIAAVLVLSLLVTLGMGLVKAIGSWRTKADAEHSP
jgi:quinol-cytochrome oxidoreductase complex cytochrome b subunit